MKTVETLAFTASLGVNEGYSNQNKVLENGLSAMERVAEVLQQVAQEIFDEKRVYVSTVVSDAKSVYSENRQCPKGGENVAHISGVCNPELTKIEGYRDAVIEMMKRAQTILGQTTTQVLFSRGELVYLKAD